MSILEPGEYRVGSSNENGITAPCLVGIDTNIYKWVLWHRDKDCIFAFGKVIALFICEKDALNVKFALERMSNVS